FGFALAGRAEQADAAVGQDSFEVMPVVVLVRDDDLMVPAGGQGRVGQDVQQNLALVSFGAGEREAHGQSLQGAQQMQAQSPEVARMAGAVPVFSPSSEVRAPGRF